MSDDDIKRCPECDYPDIYLGAWAIECGYDSNCPNWTQKQADEVERLTAERYPVPDFDDVSEELDSNPYTGPFQFSLDYGDDDDTPTWPVPDYTTTD